jgi:hypothetical protein
MELDTDKIDQAVLALLALGRLLRVLFGRHLDRDSA